MFKYIKARAAQVKESPRKGHYISANGRQYLETLNDHSSLTDGKSYIFSPDKTKVKRINNLI